MTKEQTEEIQDNFARLNGFENYRQYSEAGNRLARYELQDLMQQAYNLDRNEWVLYGNGKNIPKTQGDGKEYLIRGEKATNQKYIDHVVCWFDEGKFYVSHGNMREYEDNNDLMFITHWMPLPKPPIP